MLPDAQTLSHFREQLKVSHDRHRALWSRSRSLVESGSLQATLERLLAAVRASSYPPALQEALAQALGQGKADRVHDLPANLLKQLTGLPATKAVRSLCLLFDLAAAPREASCASWSPEQVEAFVRADSNPFDLLREADVASVLELGAGDLTFASALVDQYLPESEIRGRTLTVHCVDRLQPGSSVGGLYHADPEKLARLRTHPSDALAFKFWGGRDMFDLARVPGIWPRYSIVTCQAPPTPTVALEPTRLSPDVIRDHLRRTKGEFRLVRQEDEEEVLEVRHADRTLVFPPWKFEIKGPLAFLRLVADRGLLCVLSAVDTEVFWELMSELLADPAVRPRDTVLTPSIIHDLFGPIGRDLAALPVGGALVVSDHAAMRDRLPGREHTTGESGPHRRFRYVEVRRGAVFGRVPAGRTAGLFRQMTEETPPWFLVLVPE